MSRNISFDSLDGVLSMREFKNCSTNSYARNKMKKIMLSALEKEVTERQRQMLAEYFYNGKNISQIAKIYGINKSTVSRTISRALNNLRKIAYYYNN